MSQNVPWYMPHEEGKKIAVQAGDDDDEPLQPHPHVDDDGDAEEHRHVGADAAKPHELGNDDVADQSIAY